ncbi:hypothetical protein N0A02_02340 [Paraburkholderia acidicola]|uniref:Acid stress chaperone HdeA n=1 Tax=Paraburkholderia acidicola TaxID=1912599 RepID=A0ABV1LG68_9BURK
MQSKTKNTIRVAVALCLASALCGAANGQEIPPACAQIVLATEICSADIANWLDFNDPVSAAKVRENDEKSIAKLKEDLQLWGKEKGTIAVAQFCAGDLKRKVIGQLGGSLFPILMNHGDASNCQNTLATMQ